MIRWLLRRPTHYALGKSFDSACGIAGLWHRGLSFTRAEDRTTCRHCLRWLAKQPKPMKVVSP